MSTDYSAWAIINLNVLFRCLSSVSIFTIRFHTCVSVGLDRSSSGCRGFHWMAPVDPALTAVWPRYRRWEEKRRWWWRWWGWWGGYSCGASRCSLIVPGDCAASSGDPLLLCADGAVSSIMGMRWLKPQSVKPPLITWVLLDGLRVARLNVKGRLSGALHTCPDSYWKWHV